MWYGQGTRRRLRAPGLFLANRLLTWHGTRMWIVAIVFIVIFVGVLVLAEVAKRRIPETYRVINAVAWTIEGAFIALAVAGLIYQYATGHFP